MRVMTEGTLIGEAAPDSFEAIEKAVMESKRGRWFLDEYVKRRSGGETQALLAAIGKLENAANNNHELVAERLGKALGLITAIDGKLSPAPARATAGPAELKPEHMKFFKQDEELFEAPAKPAVFLADRKVSEPQPGVSKGAKLVINHASQTATESDTPAEHSAGEFTPAKPIEEAADPKNRIVIIRHKAGETMGVPLHDELRASA